MTLATRTFLEPENPEAGLLTDDQLKTPGGKMKIRSAIALLGLAISFALPTFAQQTNKPDPQLRERLITRIKAHTDALDKNDAAAVAANFTEDAVNVEQDGTTFGREAIEKLWADRFQKVHFSDNQVTVDDDSPHVSTDGKEMWATGAWSATIKGENFGPTQIKGYWSVIRVGDDWKIRMLTSNVTPAPAPPTAATQEKSAVDPEVRQEIEALLVKGDEAYNKRDAAALAARYTEDAVLVGGGNKLEPHYPRQNIEQRRALDMTSFPGEMSHELLQLYQLGIDVCAISKLSIGPWKGYGVFIFVREADGWKIQSEYDGTLIE
ncbi:MAG: hypothetical protein C5B58_11080 [Acidobacteria bacterium]|nr:MAG: hypothetical protein C5B58_11080 [Acidobacteriota bacterium]